MTRNLIATAALIAAAALPMAAQAQNASNIQLSGEVTKQCMLGAPSSPTLSFGDLTGADGKLTTALTGGGTVVETEIPNAWCNAPATLTVSATPMSQGAAAPAYSTPSGFSRLITYDADITGWVSAINYRPTLTSPALPTTSAGAHGEPLVIRVGELQTLDAAGATESAGLVVEAGNYSGVITLTLAAQ